MKIRLKTLVFITLTLGLGGRLVLSAPSPSVQLLACDENKITIAYTFPPPAYDTIPINGQLLEIPRIYELSSSGIPGRPQLPQQTTVLAVPPNAKVTLEINHSEMRLPEIHQIAPAKNAFTGEFLTDPKIYGRSSFFPEQWGKITAEGWMRGQRLLQITVYPMRYHPKTGETIALKSLRLTVHFTTPSPVTASPKTTPTILSGQAEPVASFWLKSVLNSDYAPRWQQNPVSIEKFQLQTTPLQKALKIPIQAAGIYFISNKSMKNSGFEFDPTNFQLHSGGIPQPVVVLNSSTENDDFGSDFLFLGVPPQNDSSYFHPYTDTNLYWLTDAGSTPLTYRPDSVTAIPTKHIESVRKKFHFEKEQFYHHGDSNIDIYTTAQVPGEGWVWKFFYPGDTQTFPFELARLSTDTALAYLTVKVHGMTLDQVNPDHHVQFEINNQIVGEMYFNDREDIRFQATFSSTLLKNGPNQLRVTSVGGTGASLDQFYMDWFEVDVTQELAGHSHMLDFEMPPQNAVCQFSITDLPTDSVWILETNTRRLVKPLTLEREKRLTISAESAGHSAGYFARILLNGETVTFSGKRGINIAIINPADGTVMETAVFDTYKSTTEADSLARRIAELDTGTIVIAAIRDDGASNLNAAAIQALENLGSTEIGRLQFRDSWAIIGRKGAPAGTVPEKYVPAGTETAMIQETIWFQAPNAPYHLTFVDSVFVHRNYAITTPRDWLTPSALWADTSSQLHDVNNGADWIVITHPLFEKSAQRLADHRAAQGWRTKVVFIQDIYDEFSYGQLDPAAIRSFLSYTYTNWQKPAPTAVVLMGDASWDMKKNSSTSIKTNFIPAYGNPVSDHWYVCFDGPNDNLPEMLIGRLPVETVESAAAVVEKIITYQNQPIANWHKKALFITGGFNSWEQSLFIEESNRLSETYVQAPPAACRPQLVNKTTEGRIEGELKPEIESAINAGQLWVNFLGHSASRTWDLMFNNPDIDELTNENRLPLVTSMTCHTARFANPEIDCFGEHFINIPEKGAIAFWGTSGWGYISPDITLLNGAYSAVYTDTVRYLGNVFLQAKLNLWNKFANSVYGISTIQQYALLGDPLCALPLPPTPELVLTDDMVTMSPEYPARGDSTIWITITPQNRGLLPPDSVRLHVRHIDPKLNENVIIADIKIPPFGYEKSVTVRWDPKNLAGEHLLRIQVDPENDIPEMDENNNQVDWPVLFTSDYVTLLKPFNYQVIRGENPQFHVISALDLAAEKNQILEFEIDTTNTFDSPAKIYGQAPVTPIITQWHPAQPLDEGLWFWRCRPTTSTAWKTHSFHVNNMATDFQAEISAPEQWREMGGSNTETTVQGATLAAQPITFTVQSGGFHDGNFARIYRNNEITMETKRGFNVALFEPETGVLQQTAIFDTWKESADADSMANFIRLIPDNSIVSIAIRDEAAQNMNENSYQALESIGSHLCREISSRCSWAIIGRKNAMPGSVPEALSLSGNGAVTVNDTLVIYPAEGRIFSPVLGPATHWYEFTQKNQQPAGTNIETFLLGYDPVRVHWDTLFQISTETLLSLETVSAQKYPQIRSIAHLKSDNVKNTPVLNSWTFTYSPAADLAVHNQTLSASADSVLEGTSISLSARITNIGFSDALAVPALWKQVSGNHLNSDTLWAAQIRADSSFLFKTEWTAVGKNEPINLEFTIDPAGKITELYETNNSARLAVSVQADSLRPEIEITFDGDEIRDQDWVSARPLIDIQIQDNGTISQADSTRMTVFLDSKNLFFGRGPSPLMFIPGNKNSGTIQLRPDLSPGLHNLRVLFKDAAGNVATESIIFEIASRFQLDRVLNYPNPFRNYTKFTYILTQPAETVRISIFTLAGRKIQTLEYLPGNAGFNQYEWDGRDFEGDGLANGVYLYQIQARHDDKVVKKIEKLIKMR